MKDFLSKTDINSGNVRVGIMVYSSQVHQIFQLRTHRYLQQVLQAVDKIEFIPGLTNTTGALNVMRTEMFSPRNGDRADVPNYAIVLTGQIVLCLL